MKKPHRLNIRVTSAMLRQLGREARGHGVTMTAIIETALQRYFDTE
ncbi:ribbon-helix-helix protein, CopG family [Hyphomonas sp.]